MADTRSDPGTEARASQVFEAWLLRKAQSTAEPLKELVARHPELRASLEQLADVDALCERALPKRTEREPLAPPIERMIGDFRIVRQLGEGAMGVVYEAEQVSLRRRVALKVLAAHLTLNERALKRFQHEAEITGRLRHRNIIDIHQVGEVAGVHCITMELVEGTSLERVIERMRRESFDTVRGKPKQSDVVEAYGLDEPPAPAAFAAETRKSGRGSGSRKNSTAASNKSYIETALKLICEVADALDHAHKAGVIHRDVKPSNILVRRDGSAVLTDFGLAREEGLPAVSQSGDFVGTPNYVSPEQAMSGRVPIDLRTDVFSLGTTLYELLTLELPFSGDNVHTVLAAIISKPPHDPGELNPALAPDLVTIILKALEKDVDQRYQSAAELAEDLRAFIDYRPIKARRTPTVVRAWRWVKREPLKAGLASVLIVGLPLLVGLANELIRSRRQVDQTSQALRQEQLPELIDRGFLALGVGERARAESTFLEALASDGTSAEAAAGRAMAMLAEDRWAEALEALEQFTTASGASPVLDRLRADALRELDRSAEADEIERGLREPEQPLERFVEAIRLIHDRPFLSGMPPVSPLVSGLAGADQRSSASGLAPGDDAFSWADTDRDSLVRTRERAGAALDQLARAIEIESDRAVYHFARAWAVWLARDRTQASRTADAILAKWPDLPMALFYSALASEVFDTRLAMERYDAAIRGDPELAEAVNRRANLFLRNGEIQRALDDLAGLVEREPERASYHVNLGCAWLQAGQPEQALRCARQALERDPDDVPARDLMGTAYYQMGKLEEAEESLRIAVELEPAGARLRNDHGLVLLELGQPSKAADEWRRALELDPAHPYAAYNLGCALFAGGQPKQAAESLRRSIESYDESVHREFPIGEAWGALGAVHAALEERQEALAALRKAVELLPDSLSHNGNLGVELYELKRFEESVQPLQKALSADPSGVLHRMLVSSLDRLSRRAEALAIARAWTERFPQDAEAWNQRAWLQVDPRGERVGDPADGLSSARKAKDLFASGNYQVLDTYACALFASGRLEEARDTAIEAASLADDQGAEVEIVREIEAHIALFEAAE